MIIFTAITNSVVYIVFLLFLLIYRYKKAQRLNLSCMMLLAMILINGMLFVFCLINSLKGYNIDLYIPYFRNLTEYDIIKYYFLSFLFTLVVILFLEMLERPSKKSNKQLLKDYVIVSDFSNQIKTHFQASWLILFLSIGLYSLYLMPYGGYLGYLNYSALVRSGIKVIDNPFSFFNIMGSLSFVSTFIFYSIVLESDKRYQKKALLGLIISLLFSIYVLYATLGRMTILVFIMVLISSALWIKIKYKRTRVFLGIIICLLIIPSIYLLSIYLNRTNDTNIIKILTSTFSFPFVNFSIQSNNYGLIDSSSYFRFFQDILFAPLYLLPSKIWSIVLNFKSASSMNTYYFFGSFKGENSVQGEMPLDILTFGYMQLGIFGVIVIAILFSLFIFFLDKILKKISIKSIRTTLGFYFAYNFVLRTILYGDTSNLVPRAFSIIIYALIYVIISKLKERKAI